MTDNMYMPSFLLYLSLSKKEINLMTYATSLEPEQPAHLV